MQNIAPFPSAEAAWFWAVTVLEPHDRPAAAATPESPRRPCRPEEVVKCLDELYRHRRIELLHARILRHYGLRGRAPDPARPLERGDWRRWREAIGPLDFKLRQRGLLPPLV